MPISITCQRCQAAFHVPDELKGKTIRCKACRTHIFISATNTQGGGSEARRSPRPIVEATPAASPRSSPTRKPMPVSRYEDDDEDDRPRPRSRKRGASSNPSQMVMLVGGLGFILLAAAGAGAFFLLSGEEAPDSATKPPISEVRTAPVTPVVAAVADAPALAPINVPMNPADVAPPVVAVATPDTPRMTVPGVPPASRPAESWRKVAASAGFEAEMPGVPAAFGSSWQLLHQGEIYAIDYRTDRTVETIVAQRRAEPHVWAAPLGLRLVSDSDIERSGFKGKELRYASPDGRHAGVLRVYAVGDRTYVAAVAVPAEGADSAKIKRFLDSFTITHMPPRGATVVDAGPVPRPPGMSPPRSVTPPSPDDPASAPPAGPGFPGVPAAGGGLPGKATLVAKLDAFWAVAFAPNKGEVYTIGSRPLGTGPHSKTAGMLHRYSYPDFKLKGNYQLPNLASKAVLDEAKGLLYVAALTKPELLLRARLDYERTHGDGMIQIFDLNPVLEGKVPERGDLKPVGILNVGGKPIALDLSPDAKWLHCLSEPTYGGRGVRSRLIRFDTARRAVDKDLTFPEPIRDMCRSADGTKFYLTEWPVGPNNVPIPGKAAGVAVAELTTWTRGPTLPLPAFTFDLTASPADRLVATVAGTERNRLFTLDTGGTRSEEIPTTGLAANSYAQFTPDGRTLVVSSVYGQGGVDIYDVTDPTTSDGFRLRTSLIPEDNSPTSGYFRLCPDGSLALFHTGAVIDVLNAGR